MIKNVIDVLLPHTEDPLLYKCFTDVSVREINIFKNKNKMELLMFSDKLLPLDAICSFEKAVTNKAGFSDVLVRYDVCRTISINEIINEYWSFIIDRLTEKAPAGGKLLSGCSWQADETKLVFCIPSGTEGLLKSLKCKNTIESIIERKFSRKVKVMLEVKDELYCDAYEKAIEEHTRNECARLMEETATAAAFAKNNREFQQKNNPDNGNGRPYTGSYNRSNMHRRRKRDGEVTENTIYGLDFEFDSISPPIGEITEDMTDVHVKGEIVSIETRELKSNKYLLKFNLTDYTGTIGVKCFLKNEETGCLSKLKAGLSVKVRGVIQYDQYDRENLLFAKDIALCRLPGRSDSMLTKRVELHLHTTLSAMDAITTVEKLITQAAEWGHSAVAITDHGVVQAYPDAFNLVKKLNKTGNNIKLIYGLEGYLIEDEGVDLSPQGNTPLSLREKLKKAPSYHIILLARNKTGLKNIYRLVTSSHLDYYYKKPRIPRSLLLKYREGLLAGSACEAGELYTAMLAGKNSGEIKRIAEFYDYLEIQPVCNNRFMIGKQVEDENALKEINKKIYLLGKELGKPVVATCDVHFLEQRDEVFRRILMAGQGYEDADRQAPLFFRTTGEMLEEFSYLGVEAANEVVVKNTNLIAEMTEKMELVPKGMHTPKIEGASEEIRQMSVKKAEALYGYPLPQIVAERMNKELDSIIGNNFAVMYLIAQRLVSKSLSDGYLVGSRGSVGSSLVAFLTGITEVNSLPPHYFCKKCRYSDFIATGEYDIGVDLPDKLCPSCGEMLSKDGYDIPFETFLGFEGDKVPDIDLNFSGEYQPVIHKYTEELFGEGHVFRAGTISTIADKTAFGYVKKYMEERRLCFSSAETDRLTRGCTGVKKTTGQHPGGIMILPEGHDIFDFTPVQHPADDNNSETITTHFDYNFLHDSLLKLDILGHTVPTMIRMLQDVTGYNALDIDIGDKKTMLLFKSTDPLGIKPEDIGYETGTLGIPEFGTNFVIGMLLQTKPSTMSELIKISGLSHGTNVWRGNAEELIKQGVARLSDTICCRDDIMIYLIHKGLSPKMAFNIMESVRKGRGLSGEMEEAMLEKEIPDWYIASCKKIEYMFPKAHASAYVIMAFRIAWYKVYFPLAFYATYYSANKDSFDAEVMTNGKGRVRTAINEINQKGKEATNKEKDQLAMLEIVNEMYARGLSFLPVDIYKSSVEKFLIENGKIRPPLISVQGLGKAAAISIEEVRKNTRFSSVEDLRIKTRVSKTVLEVLDRNGCLKELPHSSQMSLLDFAAGE